MKSFKKKIIIIIIKIKKMFKSRDYYYYQWKLNEVYLECLIYICTQQQIIA